MKRSPDTSNTILIPWFSKSDAHRFRQFRERRRFINASIENVHRSKRFKRARAQAFYPCPSVSVDDRYDDSNSSPSTSSASSSDTDDLDNDAFSIDSSGYINTLVSGSLDVWFVIIITRCLLAQLSQLLLPSYKLPGDWNQLNLVGIIVSCIMLRMRRGNYDCMWPCGMWKDGESTKLENVFW